MIDIEEEICTLRKQRTEFALCTIVNLRGSTPRDIGAKMIVTKDGGIKGTIGGGELEMQVMRDARAMLDMDKTELKHYDLLHQLNMCCGGSVDVFIQSYTNPARLYIFGAGHTGKALAINAADLKFEVFVIDGRKEWLDTIDAQHISKMQLDYTTAMTALPFDARTYICIMTYSHPIDREILAYCLHKPFAYLGMIGSRRKTEMTRKIFLESGVATEAEIERIDMPMGIEIGAEGPEEIAISVLAKLIRVRSRFTPHSSADKTKAAS